MKTDILFNNADAVLVTSNSNLFYFSRYTNADATIVLFKDKKYYVSDKRITEEAAELLTDFTVVDCDKVSALVKAIELLKEHNAVNVGYEDEAVLLTEYKEISAHGFNLVGKSKDIAVIRSIKEEYELERMKKAQAITDRVYQDILAYVKPGMTELDVCAKMNSQMYAYGGELAFETIVAFGKNTSKPHAHPSQNVLQANDVVTLDFGAKFGGYCSDMTRSFAIGKVSDRYKEIYNAVLEAQVLSCNSLKAGMLGKEGDAVARNSFIAKGLGGYFTHSLGHSLGVDIHESPNWSPRCETIIPEKAVLSVEPGLYFPGEFGVRIEDIALFDKIGSYNLTKSPKELIIL